MFALYLFRPATDNFPIRVGSVPQFGRKFHQPADIPVCRCNQTDAFAV